ncbi:MAG TPA: hypothetical protein DCL50_00715, partial [Methylococcaceae bacterium]|nr:hypothetical protein [Methylococcaceae bacterium]
MSLLLDALKQAEEEKKKKENGLDKVELEANTDNVANNDGNIKDDLNETSAIELLDGEAEQENGLELEPEPEPE